MGNHLDRITHLQYSELPTGDPCGGRDADEQQQLRVGVAYFFSDDEEEADDRTTSPTSDCGLAEEEEEENGLQVALVQEVQYSAFCSQECIFSKLQDNREELAVYSDKTLLSMCKPGDLLELVANHSAPHWAVYTESDQVIHLHKGEIRRDSLLAISNGRRGRIVNERYRYRPLPAALVTQNAAGHLGLSARDIQWSDSESFAAWCRFGKREFKAGGEGPPAGGEGPPAVATTTTTLQQRHPEATERRYFLKVHLGSAGGVSHTLLFHRLEDMIRERRRVDASGILKELQLVNMKE